MTRSVDTHSTFTERVRALVASELDNGWTPSTVAADMQYQGFKTWNEGTVYMFAKGKREKVSLDEGVALLAVFGGRANWVIKEIESLTSDMTNAAERRGSSKRRGQE